MKVLIINGSHRVGNTDMAIKLLADYLLDKNIEFRELKLRDTEIKLPDGCADCAEGEICPNIHDEFSKSIEPSIRDYDIYIIATPTWDDGVTPLTKFFWDRIVSWCHDDRKYLKGKKLAIITHGMANSNSWENVTNWIKSVCVWEEAIFGGAFTFKSGSKIGDLEIDHKKINQFITQLIS